MRMRSVFFVLGMLAFQVHAQSSAPTSAPTDAHWRASSRLGYGPTAGLATQMAQAGGPKPWAVQSIDAAHQASEQPARIPAELTHFNQPLEQIFARFKEEREARKAGQETLQKMGDAAPGTGKQDSGVFSRDAAREAAAWRLMSCSAPEVENPLLARMTEFWFNHLNVFSGKGAVRAFVGHYELNVIRRHAFGKFEDLLLASAKHPAMLFYLDQAQSVAEGSRGPLGQARGLNENYARELMELHTLGVNGGYTQNDVRELARILTGWTVAPKQPGDQTDGFRFNARTHDSGQKRLLGTVFLNNGLAEGEQAIRMLARHPATARRVATRLATFFVSDQPSSALVDRLTRSFSDSQGDLRVTLRTLVESPEFWQAEHKLFKTPLDYACSVLTVLGGVHGRRDVAQTMTFLSQAGQPVHGWQTPDGYPTDAATWLAPEALTRRADFAFALGRQVPELQFLNTFLSTATRQRIAQEPAHLRTGLMLASPEFMRK